MAIPVTQVRTSHALSIKANGQIVGLINNWNPAQGRTLTPIYEVAADDSGNPKEYMPGNANGLTINVSRYDLYLLRMEQAFGTADLTMLTRQSQPFDLFEVWAIPNLGVLVNQQIAQARFGNRALVLSPFTDKEHYIYQNCWFTSLGRTLTADGNRIVNVNATLVYTKKLKAQGALGELAKNISDFRI